MSLPLAIQGLLALGGMQYGGQKLDEMASERRGEANQRQALEHSGLLSTNPGATYQDLLKDPAAYQRALQGQALASGNTSTAAGMNSSYGLTPFYADDGKGNVSAYQLNNKGGIQPVPLPPGYKPALPVQTINTGGQQHLVNSRTGAPINTYNNTLSPEARPETRAAQTVAVEQAKADVGAKIDLDRVEQGSNAMLDVLNKVIDHPSREFSTGTSSILADVVSVLPGTDAKDFSVLMDQLKGKTFLQAYETLKGGGQITEVEGKKAEQAQARMNEAQTDEAFLEAAIEFRDAVAELQQLARKKAGVTQKRKYNPETGSFE